MTNEEYEELSRVLQADLTVLAELAFPHRHAISEAKVRVISTILRRWLVDGDLAKLVAPLKASILLYATDNVEAKRYIDAHDSFRYFLTAGVMIDGRPIQCIYDCADPPENIDVSVFQKGQRGLSLKKFLGQPRMYRDGQWFSTEQVLRFAANKLGGNHLDFEREGLWKALDTANSYFRFGGPELKEPPNGSELYLNLEPASDEILGGVHLEVVAAAASFAQMSINGTQLLKLTKKSSITNSLRKLIKNPHRMTLAER